MKTLADGWTIVSADGSPAAHFEDTIILTEKRLRDFDKIILCAIWALIMENAGWVWPLPIRRVNVVLPMEAIENKGEEKLLTQLNDIIKGEKIDEIVIGMPYSLNSQKSAQTRRNY